MKNIMLALFVSCVLIRLKGRDGGREASVAWEKIGSVGNVWEVTPDATTIMPLFLID